jgi:RHS repeat-associated protein
MRCRLKRLFECSSRRSNPADSARHAASRIPKCLAPRLRTALRVWRRSASSATMAPMPRAFTLLLPWLLACAVALAPATAKSASREKLPDPVAASSEIAWQAIDAAKEDCFDYDEIASDDSHYNYFRDYNPRTGRYQQSDPIELLGGTNTFTFVGANPLYSVDPRGLARKQYPAPGRPSPGNTGGMFQPGTGSSSYRDHGFGAKGWIDRHGNCLIPTGGKGDHRGDHYDVQKADGSGTYRNVGRKGFWGGKGPWKNFPSP